MLAPRDGAVESLFARASAFVGREVGQRRVRPDRVGEVVGEGDLVGADQTPATRFLVGNPCLERAKRDLEKDAREWAEAMLDEGLRILRLGVVYIVGDSLEWIVLMFT